MSTPRSNGDRTLLDRRDLDLVDAELPRVIDGVRRSRLLARDAVSTTWEGFSLELGSRHWLRCLRPRWRDDAALHRRLSAEGVAGLAPTPTWHGDGDWPHLRWVRPGVPLSELTPVEDEVPQATRVRVLARGLDALDRLHRAGAVVGEPLEHVIAFGSDGPRVLWRDPFEAEGTPEGDMRSLAAAVLALAPHAEDPVSAMVRGWVDHPPLAARDGQALLRQAMAASLLRRRHALALLARNAQRRSRVGRLARAVRALESALPPPTLRCCVRAEHFAGLTVVHATPDRVLAGVVDEPRAELDRVLWTPEAGLDPVLNRQILRAWNRRAGGAEPRRAESQAVLGVDDAATQVLMRWLSAMARLRSARMLLAVDGAGVRQGG